MKFYRNIDKMVSHWQRLMRSGHHHSSSASLSSSSPSTRYSHQSFLYSLVNQAPLPHHFELLTQRGTARPPYNRIHGIAASISEAKTSFNQFIGCIRADEVCVGLGTHRRQICAEYRDERIFLRPKTFS